MHLFISSYMHACNMFLKINKKFKKYNKQVNNNCAHHNTYAVMYAAQSW